jgi:hypothetical protein
MLTQSERGSATKVPLYRQNLFRAVSTAIPAPDMAPGRFDRHAQAHGRRFSALRVYEGISQGLAARP